VERSGENKTTMANSKFQNDHDADRLLKKAFSYEARQNDGMLRWSDPSHGVAGDMPHDLEGVTTLQMTAIMDKTVA